MNIDYDVQLDSDELKFSLIEKITGIYKLSDWQL